MKVCPNCQRTYPDDDLNFCLDDGSVLQQAGGYNSPPPTVMMNPPRNTAPNTSFGNDNPGQVGQFQPQNYSMQPKRSSKTWIWVVGILGGLVLLCGGGFIGFIAWVGTLDTNTNRNNNNSWVKNSSTSPTPNDRTNVQTIDLSKWVQENSPYGITSYSGGEFFMSSKKKGFYYVLIAQKDYKTENATTKVNVRNVNSADSSLGFGLVVHSNTTPLLQDYSFLIDSNKKRYRIAYHEPQKETDAVKWTNSNAIKGGSEVNTLEVRDADGKMDFYVNGTLITSVRNVYGYKGGVAGIYSSDQANIAFSSFQISK
ncbi:MAG TPA: hypothetical protein PKY59_09540 [Pyrinomonadaceae bacterium]|nr:hypothetical protein [Pyrinomonadaceae bacterium]